LRWVDDGGEVVNAVHAQVGDGECSALVLLRLQLAVTGLGSERFSFGRDGSETTGTDVFDDGGDETVGGCDGDADIGLLVPARQLLLFTIFAIIATHCRMVSPNQAELASGTSARASAAALTTDGLVRKCAVGSLELTKVVDRELGLALAGLVEHLPKLHDTV